MHRHTFGVCMHVNNKIGECKNVTLAARTITGNIIMVINGKNWLAYDTSFLGFASNISEILAALADYTQAAAKQPIYIYKYIYTRYIDYWFTCSHLWICDRKSTVSNDGTHHILIHPFMHVFMHWDLWVLPFCDQKHDCAVLFCFHWNRLDLDCRFCIKLVR